MFYVFSSTKSENKSEEQVLPGDGGVGSGTGRRVSMAQIMYIHACKCKNDTF
jgi:hypothetical protein